jgi:peptide/nickel transport system permease protein
VLRRYLGRRALQTIPVLIGISLVVFLLVNLQPGDPYATMLDPSAGPELRETLLRDIGYYDPLPVKYFKWAARAVQGDFGYSIVYKEPVWTVIASRLGNTFLLSLVSLMLSTAIAVPVGVLGAVRPRSLADNLSTLAAFIGLSLPSFFFGMILIKLFAVDLGWLPISGMATAGMGPTDPGYWIDVVRHLVLPAVVLALINTAALMRYARSSLMEILRQDYIRTARAKGVRPAGVIWRHAFKNALNPLVTIVSLQLPFLFSGALLTETIFVWPGVGRLNYEAVLNRDYPLIMGIVMILAVVTLVANLIADVVYALVDPRIRYD